MRLGLVVVGLLIGLWVLATHGVPALLPAPWRPDVFLWPVVFLALFGSERLGAAPVVALGFCVDLGAGAPLGSHALLYAAAFRFVRRRRRHFQRRALDTQLLLTALASGVTTGMQALALGVFAPNQPGLSALARQSVAVVVPTVLLAPIAYGVLLAAFALAGRRTARGEVVFSRGRGRPLTPTRIPWPHAPGDADGSDAGDAAVAEFTAIPLAS